jgi:hypothetical protein
LKLKCKTKQHLLAIKEKLEQGTKLRWALEAYFVATLYLYDHMDTGTPPAFFNDLWCGSSPIPVVFHDDEALEETFSGDELACQLSLSNQLAELTYSYAALVRDSFESTIMGADSDLLSMVKIPETVSVYSYLFGTVDLVAFFFDQSYRDTFLEDKLSRERMSSSRTAYDIIWYHFLMPFLSSLTRELSQRLIQEATLEQQAFIKFIASGQAPEAYEPQHIVSKPLRWFEFKQLFEDRLENFASRMQDEEDE